MSSLSDEVHEQIAKLAKDAGQRAAARALLRGDVATETGLAEVERAETATVQERLTKRFQNSGELPPMLADLVDLLPKVTDVDHPPVITVLRCSCRQLGEHVC